MKTWFYQEASFRSKIGTAMSCLQIVLVIHLFGEIGLFWGEALSPYAFSCSLALIACAFLLTVLFRIALIKTIASPVEEILHFGESLNKGETGEYPRAPKTRDESGHLFSLLLRLREEGADNKNNKLHLDAANNELSALKNREISQNKEKEIIITSIEKSLDAVAKGDLNQALSGNILSGDFSRIANSFNHACAHWKTTFTDMARSSEFITTGAAEISMASADLARRTELQAENLGNAANAVRTISAGIQMTADVCSESSTETRKTLDQVKIATSVMEEANIAMIGIQKSSSAIGEIISVIDGITFQTNVLALNAGVEAARAGDAGRGFAVVAQEVRSLAEKSAKSANEIKRLISVSAEEVDKGVNLVHRTSQYLGEFSDSISNIAQRIEGLTKTTREQALRLAEVTHSINDMDQVTQQNAAMVEEATAASHNLTTETRSLAQTLGAFHLGNNTNSSSLPQKPATSYRKAASAPIAKPSPTKPLPNETKRPVSVPTSSKQALQVTSSDQGWEDF